jgi:hypothetical protein
MRPQLNHNGHDRRGMTTPLVVYLGIPILLALLAVATVLLLASPPSLPVLSPGLG